MKKVIHAFWLFREDERPYHHYQDLLTRHDAPLHFDDALFFPLTNTLAWLPVLDIELENTVIYTDEWNRPFLIQKEGGEKLRQLCLAWKHLFSCFPTYVKLLGPFRWTWPYEEEEHLTNFDYLCSFAGFDNAEIEREELLSKLTTLAHFAAQVSTGEYFLMHIPVNVD